MSYKIEKQEVQEIEQMRKKNKDKTIDRWLLVLLLRASGMKREGISVNAGRKVTVNAGKK